MTEYKKSVDESWKNNIEKEKKSADVPLGGILSADGKVISPETETPAVSSSPAQPVAGDDAAENFEVNFLNYITSLVFQAMIFLGEIPNPMAENKTEPNLPQAKFLIDTLILLREKTSGNLSQEEDQLLNGAIYELQMKFVEHSRGTHPHD